MKQIKKYLVIMNNVFKSNKVENRFDLKGSTVGRKSITTIEEYQSQDRDQNVALKDLDYDLCIKNLKFKKKGKLTLEQILENDA